MNEQFHSIIGLPASGKTTFLAALWHICDAKEISTDLVLDTMVGDFTYLEEIVDSWRKSIKVPRTSSRDETQITIRLRHVPTGQIFSLQFPDLSGESFNKQFSDRRCENDYVASYNEEGGMLLFINADRPSDGRDIIELMPILEGEDSSDETEEVQTWSPDGVPHQVRLVDLLQFVQRPPFKVSRRRVGVIISAWDAISQDGVTPSFWFKREYPLLDQFLESNAGSFEYRVYGVSAQGGEVPKAEDAEAEHQSRNRLLSITPSERVSCVLENVVSNDLTLPVCWISGIQ